MNRFIVAALLVSLSIAGVTPAAQEDIIEIETEGSYQMAPDDSMELAKKMAFFIAKRKAVESSCKYLARENLIDVNNLNRDEVCSLAARQIQAEILEEKQQTAGGVPAYRIRIRARIKASDFVKAKIQDAVEDQKESQSPFRKEMQQPVSAAIDPGKDIAKAYRLLREKKWRIAIIYLDHLEKKYPNWDSIYMTKAITHYILHEPQLMKNALTRACTLGNQVACNDLKNLKNVRKLDFGLSIDQ